jgi:MoxR-like ATPase
MMNLLTKLKFWAEHKYNVILEGFHGTGKTESVKQVFNELYGKQGEDWLYFSAATMDAWVDFVGVPREVTDADGTTYLDLIRPRAIAKGTVKAIFFDEFNRAPAKTRNAVMELLQFKSINGRELSNLEIIWAAINPDDDDTYDVERLDPAQKDRFHVHVKIPYDVSNEYFFEKYGRIGEYACDWWKKLDIDQRRMISPRRLDTVIYPMYYLLPKASILDHL